MNDLLTELFRRYPFTCFYGLLWLWVTAAVFYLEVYP